MPVPAPGMRTPADTSTPGPGEDAHRRGPSAEGASPVSPPPLPLVLSPWAASLDHEDPPRLGTSHTRWNRLLITKLRPPDRFINMRYNDCLAEIAREGWLYGGCFLLLEKPSGVSIRWLADTPCCPRHRILHAPEMRSWGRNADSGFIHNRPTLERAQVALNRTGETNRGKFTHQNAMQQSSGTNR